MNNVDKLVWMFMIQNGVIDGTWSFYGHRFFTGDEYDYDAEYDTNLNTKLLKSVKKHGINWDKTQVVRDTEERAFNGTFQDDEFVAVMEGKLYLNNGTSYTICAECPVQEVLQKMDSYIPDCFENL